MIIVAGGSVPGTDHTKPGQPGWTNNHDAFTWRGLRSGGFVAVVCDGCGSGKHSEVGSHLGANLLAQTITDDVEKLHIEGRPLAQIALGRVQQIVLGYFATLAKATGGSFSQTINDYFLFTIVGAIVTPEEYCIFSLGDGVFILNGDVYPLGPFPNNSPPYLMYNLAGSSLLDANPALLNLQVQARGSTKDLNWLLIGTDGVLDLINAKGKTIPGRKETVGAIEQFLSDSCMQNPDGIRRRLAVLNRETVEDGRSIRGGLLTDDTTFIIVQITPDLPPTGKKVNS